MTLDDLLETRTAQLLELTDKERESGESDNPILNGEQAPNRFATLTLFFTDEDGVRVDEDLDLSEITVTYFTDNEERELKEGALYSWAIEFYRDNY